MSHFEELKVWQKAVDLAVKVYEITKNDPFNKDFGLRDQMRSNTQNSFKYSEVSKKACRFIERERQVSF